MSLALRVLNQLHLVGVQEILVCPGARNAEFIQALTSSTEAARFKVIWHFEERSAAFFALGRIQATDRPVAVITTSGTASGELLPATMEAYYSGLPLVLVTADRPRRFRGSGAPQAAEQVNLFGIYTPQSWDLEYDEDLTLESKLVGPLHINVCLEDPRGPGKKTNVEYPEPHPSLEAFLEVAENPLVVVSRLASHERSAVEDFLLALRAPAYLEAPSGLRASARLAPIQIRVADRVFERATHAGAPFDGVLRIGGVPTHRLWRDLEDTLARLPVFNVSSVPFSGLGRPSGSSFGSLEEILRPPRPVNVESPLVRRDHNLHEQIESLLKSEETSEPGVLHHLSKSIAPHSLVFLGNSLPIREWDLAATISNQLEVVATRGLNGIDGQLSTFLGLCQPSQENWAILGDLTALYDLAGPWPLPQLEDITATVVILNNSGGRIFERMFPNPAFINAHDRHFKSWAKLWNLEYELNPNELVPSEQGLKVIELTPDRESTARFWRAFGELLS